MKGDNKIEPEFSLEQRCLMGRMLFQIRHPEGNLCIHNVADCRFLGNTDNPIVINYADGRGEREYYRCRCVRGKNGKYVRE